MANSLHANLLLMPQSLVSLFEHNLGNQRLQHMTSGPILLLHNFNLSLKPQGNLNQILAESISEESSLTCENNALDGTYIMLTHTYTFISYLMLIFYEP